MTEYDPVSGTFALANNPQAKADYLRAAEYRNTDWFDLLFNNSIQHTHSVSMSGGTEKADYYASVSAMFDPGWTKKSKVERYTANIKTNYNVSKKVKLGVVANASYRNQDAPGTLSRAVDPTSGAVSRSFDINPYSYALNTSRALDPNVFYTRNYAPFNIFHELNNNFIDLNVTDFRLQGKLDYKPLPNLELSVLGAMKFSATSQEHDILDNSNQAMAYRAMATSAIRAANSYLYTDPDNIYALPISILPQGGIQERTDHRMLGYAFRATASYNDVFGPDETHILNLYGGVETNSVSRHATWFRGWGQQYGLGEVPAYAYQAFKKGAEQNNSYYSLDNTRERSVAFFATGTYSYKRRYTVTGTIRYEGTNKLGKSRSARWLPTWNVSGAWNAHEEKFFAFLRPTLSHLTLKASYSLTADRGPSSVTNSLAVIGSRNPWRPFTSVKETMLYISDLQNSDLTYEKKHELNLGLDAGFLNDRINVAFDWYTRRDFDLIGKYTTQGAGGQIERMGNVADMKSWGVDFSISSTNIKTKDFRWNTNFIYSYQNDEITKFNSSARILDLVLGNENSRLEGYSRDALFSVPFVGLNKEGLPVFIGSDGKPTVTGIYFQESDPEQLKFLTYSGRTTPTDYGSLENTFKWKNFTLSLFVTYSFGNVVRLDPVFSNSYSDLMATPKEFKNRWIVPGDEQYTDIPVIASLRQNRNDTNLSYAYNAYNYSTARIAKGDFIRMKEISLAYDFPETITKALGVNRLGLKLQATNLFLIYADKKLNGQDPEFSNAGGVAIPMPKQFTLTLRLGL